MAILLGPPGAGLVGPAPSGVPEGVPEGPPLPLPVKTNPFQ
jgi:hypothetical protein